MKRRRRRRRNVYKNTNIKGRAFSAVMVICFSVIAGYMTATYIIGPALGLETQPAFFDFINNDDNKESENTDGSDSGEKQVVQDTLETDTENGYALQYGSFSSMDGAQKCADDLKSMGIEAEIIEKDGSYKVIGQLFETKEAARTYMEQETWTEDVFITEFP